MALYNCAGGNGGGGGGTSDYAQLSNLPQINNTTLLGNKSAADLGLVGAETGKGLSSNDYTNADKAIVDGVTSALAGKANVGDVPTKTSDLTNDSGFITNLVNNLLNYYLKTETYSKTEVDTLLQAITTLDIQAVSTLPTTNISTTTIYLVPKQDPQVPDIKDEYINLDGTTSGWELIGNTQIDLSNYVTTSDLTTALQSYATKAYVDGLIGDLSALTTTDKSSCVAAINEVNDKVGYEERTTRESTTTGVYVTNNRGFLSSGYATITKVGNKISICISGISTKSARDWIFGINEGYRPTTQNDRLYFKYLLGANECTGFITEAGYIYFDNLNTTDLLSANIEFNIAA